MKYIIADTIANLASLSSDELVEYMIHNDPNHSLEEQNSWRISLYQLIQVVNKSALSNLWLIAEYSLIGDQRIDAIICGYNKNTKHPLALLVESKQWQSIGVNTENKETEVPMTFNNGEYRIHPIAQVMSYKHQLEANHSEICSKDNKNSKKIRIDWINFLHNFQASEKKLLFRGKYVRFSQFKNKVFVEGEQERLKQHLQMLFDSKSGKDVAKQFTDGKYQLNKADFSGIVDVLQKKQNAVMIEDQIEAVSKFDTVIKSFTIHPENKAIIVEGNAGTGKTIVGLYMEYLAVKQHNTPLSDVLFTFAKSRTLHEIMQREMSCDGHKIGLPYLDNIDSSRYSIVIVDEAHRMSNVKETITRIFCDNLKPKIVVFLVDDHQRVRIDEQGTVKNISDTLKQHGIGSVHLQLTIQKRSGFQGDFISGLNSLFFGETKKSIDNSQNFEICISNSLKKIDDKLLNYQNKNGSSIKWFAPFDWKWKSRSNTNIDDIYIIDHDGTKFTKQWNPNNGQYEWYKGQTTNAFNQVGSIYTAQGLDYDYTGFIWTKSLFWNEYSNSWDFDLSRSQDGQFKNGIRTAHNENPHINRKDVLEIILNQYYVLLSRARVGTFVWFEDEVTKKHVQTTMNIKSII